MVSLVIISTIDLDDWMPGSRAPGLFVFAPLNSREKERGQGVGTLFKLDSPTQQNFLFTQKKSDRGSLQTISECAAVVLNEGTCKVDGYFLQKFMQIISDKVKKSLGPICLFTFHFQPWLFLRRLDKVLSREISLCYFGIQSPRKKPWLNTQGE